MNVKRWKLGWKRCDCIKCDHALTVEQTEENCGWVMWEHHKEEVARLKAEVERLRNVTDVMLDAIDIYRGWVRLPGDGPFREHLNMIIELMNAKDEWNAAKEGKQP